MCDAGRFYRRPLDAEEILSQIDACVRPRYPDRRVPVRKFKVQFARMGEPALNPAVLRTLEALPKRVTAPGLLPCVSTMGPAGSESFFEELRRVKDRWFAGGRFQLQFSIHSTDEAWRDRLMPARKLSLERIARIGRAFRRPGDRKITLNFAAVRDCPIDPARLRRVFDPEDFLVKITPLNPTRQGSAHRLESRIGYRPDAEALALRKAFLAEGFEAILSPGHPEENVIGSNCGQYAAELEFSRG
jgi:23S rRNA (adenine2503-C2)-methyltransferase